MSNKIQLYWSIEDTMMPHFAIQEHMAKNEKNGLPSVVDMFQQLHGYERKMVYSQKSNVIGGSVLSLERTKTDIQCRDMIFKAVPGLQFVIQGQFLRPEYDYAHPGKINARARSANSQGPSYAPPQQLLPPKEQSHQSSLGLPPHLPKRKADEEFEPSLDSSGPWLPDDVVDSQEDQEAEDLVTELLAKYTILSP